jgi:hypothetical protein
MFDLDIIIDEKHLDVSRSDKGDHGFPLLLFEILDSCNLPQIGFMIDISMFLSYTDAEHTTITFSATNFNYVQLIYSLNTRSNI